MTYRERREAKVERLNEWAGRREAKAAAGFAVGENYRGDTAFWTQPGRIPERERVFAAHQRAGADAAKGAAMGQRAAGIAAQLEHAIYSDDPDACEALTEKIATLTAKRDAMKAANAAFRADKVHRMELAALTSAYQRDQAMPHQAYELTNIGATIRTAQKRLTELSRPVDTSKPSRVIAAHRAGDCDRCGQPIELNAYIGKYPDGWSHVEADGDNWKRCEV